MLKDISELEIGCVYQYKDENFDILGVCREFVLSGNTNEIERIWFDTLSSVDNKWPASGFYQSKKHALLFLTKLS